MSHKKTVCLLGGAGFIGSHLASELVRQGYQVRISSRHPERVRHLEVLPGVRVYGENILKKEGLNKLLKGADIAINLLGILNESRRGQLAKINAEFPGILAQACLENGIHRMIHFSAQNADAEKGVSQYLRSKGQGEQAVLAYVNRLDITVFRPNVVFGQGDHFFNRFARLLKTLPLCLPLAGSAVRLAPVYVGDVVKAVVDSIKNKNCFGEIFELTGPKNYRLKELVAYTSRVIGVRKKITETGPGLSMLLAFFLERMPGQLLTRDNLRSLRQDCVSRPFPEVFGIQPVALEVIVPGYLNQGCAKTYYDQLRTHAGR